MSKRKCVAGTNMTRIEKKRSQYWSLNSPRNREYYSRLARRSAAPRVTVSLVDKSRVDRRGVLLTRVTNDMARRHLTREAIRDGGIIQAFPTPVLVCHADYLLKVARAIC